MIKLMIAPAGTGKSYWLNSQNTNVTVDCTNKPHRAVLTAIADAMSIRYASRATIDTLVALIRSAPPTAIGVDNIDRTSGKLQYSLLAMTQHKIYATATEKRRVKILLDRQAAILITPPPVKLSEIVKMHYPSLTEKEIARIAATTATPAAALHVAAAVVAGERSLPPPPSRSIYPVLIIVAIAGILLIRSTDIPAWQVALISGIAYYLRRLLWRSA